MYCAKVVLRLLPLFLGALLASAASSRKYLGRRNNGAASSPFVSTSLDGKFIVNGSEFQFIGTTAYWLPSLNSDQDIVDTISNMSAAGFKVVRTWGFNDVEAIPENGTWFQLVANGTTTINNGTNGLQRLDKVIEVAEQHGMYVLISLTNNWNPRPLFDNITILANGTVVNGTTNSSTLQSRDVTPGTNNTLPRNFLSNDYGGMDLYVRQLGVNSQHDEFYTNRTIVETFKNFTTAIVSRYANRPSVFAWEVANDPQCNSSLATSPTCTAQVVTKWHAEVAAHIKTVDPNHLVSSGNQGFFCMGCEKLFFKPQAAPRPQASPAPGVRRRSILMLTKDRVLKQRQQLWKQNRQLKQLAGIIPTNGVRIRGNWVATPTRRQGDLAVGSAFDGSHGVDSQDIMAIPQIGFSSFQLFPDQFVYGPDDPSLTPFENKVQHGLTWIQQQANSAAILNKPIALTGFGLVTQNNTNAFVPFNSSVAPFGSGSLSTSSQQPFGVTDAERDQAYNQWVNAGIIGGLQGIIQYQWSQPNLTVQAGTTISPLATENGQVPNQGETGQSPNDGYSMQGVGREDSLQSVLSGGIAQFGADRPPRR
ncbi:hypothetical protein HGRIS_013066 [Hohenbuehelia grisea]|uniref:mannan endo-1,4-beta-mannosidase n=1 Tax=Hohenbuehelia grisea TaxID=104357 RepID=A0ABR3IUH0_9AGAR